MKVHGLDVTGITYRDPQNSLPKWVRAEAATRGYGDATQPLSLFIQEDDVAEAFACAAQGNGSACVMAQAGKRIGAKSVYFYRTTVWVDFGDGPIVRFHTTKQIYNNVIDPFDRGARDEISGGIYHLMPPAKGRRLETRRKLEARRPKVGKSNSDGSLTPVHHAHTERVVPSFASCGSRNDPARAALTPTHPSLSGVGAWAVPSPARRSPERSRTG